MKITREQAIAELRATIKHISDGYYCHLAHGGKADSQVETELDALQFAVNELEKEIPQKPIEDGYYDKPAVCPNCGESIIKLLDNNYPIQHCLCCGQALDFTAHLTEKGGAEE